MIIKRGQDNDNKENYIIGLHKGSIKNKRNKVIYNLGTTFDSILNNIKEQVIEINCIYIPDIPDKDKKEIFLMNDYNLNIDGYFHEDNNKLFNFFYLQVPSLDTSEF